MSDRNTTVPAGGVDGQRQVSLTGTFTIGAAGAISAQDSSKITGTTATKNAAAGRYDMLTYRQWTRIVGTCSIIGPTSAAFGNVAGNTVQFRNPNPTSATSQFQIQAFLASSGADTDLPSGTIVQYVLHCYGK